MDADDQFGQSKPLTSLDKVLNRPCPMCGGHRVLVRALFTREQAVTLRCAECGHLQHLVPLPADEPHGPSER